MTISITLEHRVPRQDLALGVVLVEGVSAGPSPDDLAAARDALVARRGAEELSPAAEARRKASRDVLRNGRYKPTGRGKPANEYLLRAARQGEFPRINGPVDANNLVSLEACVPISLWDLELAGVDRFEVRLGGEGESYVFNPSGQTLGLHDLVCGCALSAGESRPLVTPIKDGMATKVHPGSRCLAGLIYYPLPAGDEAHLGQITADFLGWLQRCGPRVQGAMALLRGGQRATLTAGDSGQSTV